MSEAKDRRMKVRQALAVAVAGMTLGVTGAFAVASAQDDPAPRCGPTESDLLRAAQAARRLEAQRPDLFAQTDRPASYDDLRLAAEWARRLSYLHPIDGC
jgi:hypothetical protein